MQTKHRKDVHDLKFREMTITQLQEESLIDLAFAILEDKKNSLTLKELFDEIQHYNGLTDEVLQEYNDLFIETNRELLEAAGVIE